MPASNTTVEPGEDQPDWTTTATLSEPLAVGDTITFSKQITESDVRAFAQISGDTNPLHLDADAANDSMFGEQLAHGILVSGLISAALARLPGVVVYLSQDLAFYEPAFIDDELTAVCEITDTHGDNRFSVNTSVSRGDTTVIGGSATILINPSTTK